MFIPDRIWVKINGEYAPIDRAAQPEPWLSYVYSNRSIVTQFDDGHTKWPQVGTLPTSSASMPSVVAAMLSYSGLDTGQDVCEVGTGTGYNAALTASLVGNLGHVSTIEVDPELAEAARERLDNLAYDNVRTVLGDGAHGDPDAAPFDRIIVTAGVQLGRVPYAWIEQTRRGGKILAPVRTDLTSGPLVLWTVDEDGRAVGKAMPMGVGFMELRAQRTPTTTDTDLAAWLDNPGDESTTDLDAKDMLSNPHSRWALAVAMPSCRYDLDHDDDGENVWWLRDPMSGSWARIASGAVHQSGPRRLWDEAEAAYAWWLGAGEPSVVDWTWTITPTRQSVTLNS
ncbi:methyltransferase domain-containing protein [Saccharopolyspora hattusasensis]|uniref:methyltransferase domain-containing protein n=1 Tax=Saccharopolyspora hattusasensis TaxID=1128679 RepID=UPI003D9799AF